jgi:hypothetical protein
LLVLLTAGPVSPAGREQRVSTLAAIQALSHRRPAGSRGGNPHRDKESALTAGPWGDR